MQSVSIRNRQGLPRLVARRIELSPAPHDVLVSPAQGDVRIEPQQEVDMIIHHREPADADRKDFGELLDAVFEPLSSVGRSFSKQKRAPDSASRAVIPAGHGETNELSAGDGHCGTPMAED